MDVDQHFSSLSGNLFLVYHLVNKHSDLENGPVDIMDFPVENMVDFSSSQSVSHYQAGYLIKLWHLCRTTQHLPA